jgi:biofilm PGA synthesis N-glycosyltransferase PgaC
MTSNSQPACRTPTEPGEALGMTRRYAIVSPVRNEATYARRTLESVVNQTVLPTRWLIVDDGSTDATPEILQEYAARYDFIEVLRKPDRGRRSVGPGVIEAVYVGLDRVRLDSFDYLCKLDLDLDLPKTYFENLIDRMEKDPRIGTCSGKAYFPAGGTSDPGFGSKLVSEGIGDEVSVGASKFYRVACFRQIGGFVREVMWDGIDCHTARMRGWVARSWDAPELRFLHLRPMGSSQIGVLTGRMRHGSGQYFMGTNFVYMLASSVFRMAHKPYVLGGAAMMWGYLRSALHREARYDNPEFRKFLNRYQWACLLIGKKRATHWFEDCYRAHWDPGPARGPGTR